MNNFKTTQDNSVDQVLIDKIKFAEETKICKEKERQSVIDELIEYSRGIKIVYNCSTIQTFYNTYYNIDNK